MKKTTILSFLITTLATISGLGQTNMATYSYQMSEDVPETMMPIREQVNQQAQQNYLLLYFDKKNSFYTSENIENDIFDDSDIFASTYNPYFYDGLSETYSYEYLFDKTYTAIDKNLYEWEITTETKEISGYSCVKAIGKAKNLYAEDAATEKSYNTVEAWFAPSLPYSFGPYKYAGLPGLVIYAVGNNKNIFKLEKLSFEVDFDWSETTQNYPQKPIEQLIKAKREYNNNIN